MTLGCELIPTSADTVSNLVSDQPSTSLPALLYLLVAGFGLTGGAFLSRRLSAARYGLRH